MIVVMKLKSAKEEINDVQERLEGMGFRIHPIIGTDRIVIGAIGDRQAILNSGIEVMPGVEQVIPIMKPYKLASRELNQEDTIVEVEDVKIGGKDLVVMAGPCAVEGMEQLLEIAHMVKDAGAKILRGGAFKPRTSPYSFQGLGEEGLKMMAEAKKQTGLKIVTEIMDVKHIDLVSHYADILQIGARNMHNFSLLREVGQSRKPVLLKRGMSATIEEWLMAAEYIMSEGNHKVILCERGIRTYETHTRNTLDISAVPVIKQLSHLPIIVDPSHGSGQWRLVNPLSKAAVIAGADGLMIEVHPNPSQALSDGAQSLTPKNFRCLMKELEGVGKLLNKSI